MHQLWCSLTVILRSCELSPTRKLTFMFAQLSTGYVFMVWYLVKHHHHHHHHHHRRRRCRRRRLSRIRPLGLFRFGTYFSETYKSIGQLVGYLGRGISPTQDLYLHTGKHNTQKCRHPSMPRMGLEPTIAVFEQSKAVRAADRPATGTGLLS
jgi:hypothetical protein